MTTEPQGDAAPRRARSTIALVVALAAAPACPLVQAVPVTYTQTVYNTTSSDTAQVGLGSHVFNGPDTFTYLVFTFVGDTANVRPYTVGSTSGYIIDAGTARVEIHDLTNGVTLGATFDPGEVYVGTDFGRPGSGGGLGFGSRIYPIYPYALLQSASLDLTDPLYDLQHEFSYGYFALSCVSITSSCLNRDAGTTRANYALRTDQGDFWVTWQGITSAYFNVTLGAPGVPEPMSAALVGLGLAALVPMRRRRARAAAA